MVPPEAELVDPDPAQAREPIGGRLVPLKRLIYWFTASAFDRQAKVQEAMLAVLVEMEQELAAPNRQPASEPERPAAPTGGPSDR